MQIMLMNINDITIYFRGKEGELIEGLHDVVHTYTPRIGE